MAIRCSFEKNYPEIAAQNRAALERQQREMAERQRGQSPDIALGQIVTRSGVDNELSSGNE